MSEPTDAIPPDDYTFTRPEGLLAHYTKASTAFEDILPGKLRLSPYRLMRDPAENKDLLQRRASRRFRPPMPRPTPEVHAHIYADIQAARDRMRVFSLTRDTEDRGEYPSFDCCWSRPRMWEQYGDDHRGVCLLFDRARLERVIREQWPDQRTRQFGNVEYRRDGSAKVFQVTVLAPRILSDEEDPVRAVPDFIEVNRDAYFFLKSDDFATEYEYRVVLTGTIDDRDEYAYVDYGDSLVGVVLGERVPEWQEPGAVEACSRMNVKLGRMEWVNGLPGVVPVGWERRYRPASD
jgi:hypothetical protein